MRTRDDEEEEEDDDDDEEVEEEDDFDDDGGDCRDSVLTNGNFPLYSGFIMRGMTEYITPIRGSAMNLFFPVFSILYTADSSGGVGGERGIWKRRNSTAGLCRANDPVVARMKFIPAGGVA